MGEGSNILSKKFKGFFREPFVGTIEEINKRPQRFYDDASNFIDRYDNNKRDNLDLMFSRFIDLLKYTDVYISDDGNINNKFNNLLDKILYLKIDGSIKRKTCSFKNDIRILNKIKEDLVISENIKISYYYETIRYCNFKLYELLIDGGSNIALSEKLEQVMSFCINKIKNKSKYIKLEEINYASESGTDVLLQIQFSEIVKMWKYAAANLIDINGKLTVDVRNQIAESFVITRNINKENRDLKYNMAIVKKKKINERISGRVKGVGEEFFAALSSSPSKLNYWKNILIYDISMEDWFYIFNELKGLAFNLIIKKRLFFVEVSQLKLLSEEKLNNELETVARVLSFKNDLLDTPFLILNGKLVVCLTAILFSDPIHLIHIVMKYNKNKSFQNMRGQSFENEIGRILKEGNLSYCKAENNKNNEEIKIQYGRNNEHEIDVITEDRKKGMAFIECKTFMDPFSYKDYRIELDKMISRKYLYNANSHYKSLKKVGHKTLYNNVFINHAEVSQNKSLRRFLSVGHDWPNMYAIFISNMIFPDKLIRQWQKEYSLNFVHWFEFSRLVKGIPLKQENVYYNANNNNIKIMPWISIDFPNVTFNENGVKAISIGQPLCSLVRKRKDIINKDKKCIVPDKISEEIFKCKNVVIKYYD